MTPKQLLYDISYANLLMLSKAAPDYSSIGKDKKKSPSLEDAIDGNDAAVVMAEYGGSNKKRIRVRR